jgi:NitT/TauT family transport system ATP-binding protein
MTASPAQLAGTAAGAPVVRVEQVSQTYRSGAGDARAVTAIEQVSFEVGRNEFVSLLGPSGCGKSTLLRIVAGLTPPSGGTCLRSLSNQSAGRAHAGRIGFVFQDATLMPWSTVTSNVLLPFRIAGQLGAAERERGASAIRAVGLAGFEQAYPRELSGGMRMRVSIARALVTDPDLLLLDEPFAALDEITRMQLADDLLRVWEERRPTILFVTHSVFESVYLSTRIAVMTARPGRISADMNVDLPHPRSRATRSSAGYMALCDNVSAALGKAMGGR